MFRQQRVHWLVARPEQDKQACSGIGKPSTVPGVEGFAAAVVLIAVLLGVLFVVAFDLFCLVRLAARDDRGFRPKLAWAVAIVCISPFGGLVYLLSSANRLNRKHC